MHGLIPRAVEEALQERGIEPIDTPNVRDVALEENDRTYEGPIVAQLPTVTASLQIRRYTISPVTQPSDRSAFGIC